MKSKLIVVMILILPSTSFGQDSSGYVPWDIDLFAPICGSRVEVDFGRRLWNTIGLFVSPKTVKGNWPLYAYDLETLTGTDSLCQDGSHFSDLSVGNDIAVISELHQGDASSVFVGWRFQSRVTGELNSGTPVALKFNDLCNVFLNQNLERIQQTLAGNLAFQSWMQERISEIGSHFRLTLWAVDNRVQVTSSDWVPLLEGTLTESDSMHDGQSPEFVLNILGRVLRYRWIDATPLGFNLDTVRQQASGESYGNLFVSAATSHDAQSSPHQPFVFELFKEETVDSVEIATLRGNRFRIWYKQPHGQSHVDNSWYLLSDEPMPGVASDIRIDRNIYQKSLPTSWSSACNQGL